MTLQEHATIRVTQREIVLGRYERFYTWEGPEHAPARVYRLDIERWHDDLPWPFVVVEDEPWRPDVLIMRTDGKNAGTALAYRLGRLLGRLMAGFECRAVLTAMIWGVGWVEPGHVPTWHCLRNRRP